MCNILLLFLSIWTGTKRIFFSYSSSSFPRRKRIYFLLIILWRGEVFEIKNNILFLLSWRIKKKKFLLIIPWMDGVGVIFIENIFLFLCREEKENDFFFSFSGQGGLLISIKYSFSFQLKKKKKVFSSYHVEVEYSSSSSFILKKKRRKISFGRKEEEENYSLDLQRPSPQSRE